MRLRPAIAGGIGALALVAAGLGAAPAGAFTPGAAGLGDPYFPGAGNGGYDVAHYHLRLHVKPAREHLWAEARITATATQALSAFNLDYAGPRVRSVRVDGAKAGFERAGRELVVTPRDGIEAGTQFVVEVAYAGRPRPLRDPDGAKEGWFATNDGTFVAGEPRGSITWYPSNDHPTDKATFEFRVTVPKRLKAIANGGLVKVARRGGSTTYTWREREPMATYLATVATGRFRLDRSKIAGIRSVVAVDPRKAKESRRGLRHQANILELFSELFGPYPFSHVGAIVDDASFVGYALETQTRPIYSAPPGDNLIAHELAHQWFGDSVTLELWHQIWLNEGFATWAQWRWDEHRGGPTTARVFAEGLAVPANDTRFWDPPPGNPGGPENLFDETIYDRGAMALEALRQQVGEQPFYATLQAWAAQHRHANASIDDFIALAEVQSGQQLDSLFQTWLYQPGKP